MKQDKFSSLGFDLMFNVPATVEEYNENAKNADGCRRDAVLNVVYRGQMPDFRYMFLHGDEKLGIKGIEELTGIEREFESRELKTLEADGSKKTVDTFTESEAKYWNRVKATLIKNGEFANETELMAHFQPSAQEIADKCVFDASETEAKVRKPKTASKENTAIAQKYVDQGKGDKLAALLSTKLGRTITADVPTLALAMAEDFRNEEAKARANMLNAILQ